MILKTLRKLTKPIEDATIDVATDVATDITAKTAQKTAEKSAEAGIDAFFNGLDYAAKRTREKGERIGGFALYCLTGGLKTEFQISSQRIKSAAKDIKKQRQKKIRKPRLKK